MARQESLTESPYRRGDQAGSAALAVYDEQICAYLGSFVIPADYQARLYDYVLATTRPHPDDDLTEQRRRLEAQLKRLRDLYLMGDIEKARFTSERERLKRDLTLLEMRVQGQATHIENLAKLLANVAAAWAAAQPEQRNRLARLLFEEIVINNERVATVKPRPELAGFFLLNHQEQAGRSCACCTGGPDGDSNRSIGGCLHVHGDEGYLSSRRHWTSDACLHGAQGRRWLHSLKSPRSLRRVVARVVLDEGWSRWDRIVRLALRKAQAHGSVMG